MSIVPFGEEGLVWAIRRQDGSLVGSWRTNDEGFQLFQHTPAGWTRSPDPQMPGQVVQGFHLHGGPRQAQRALGRFAALAVVEELDMLDRNGVTLRLASAVPFPEILASSAEIGPSTPRDMST
jgi:hypothetical protein